ncbi:MAG: 30S ribosomal protein S17 [Phaeodactylibacter sp.]|nr:30S ribosomal protein S17 [Phaeodactylibacter sp.]MCB9266836.1 30S ribosomal protein S17 [Lewinellaceae bacterium]MCB9287880.1 30S ribosomal protein S17 [Lewinellaceae bacterium]
MENRNLRKQRIGVVTSNKMDKAIAVSVERRLRHPIYGKFVKKSNKFIAHDENNDCNIGDTVRIMECRPLSKRKRWRLVEIIERAK